MRRTRRSKGALTESERRRPSLARMELGPPLVAAVAALLLGVPRLCPTLCLMGDSAIFVSAAASLGVPQPPGYPLYSALGHVATLVPWGELPWRVHATSAIYHALTVGLVAAIVQRVTCSRLAAVVAAVWLAAFHAFLLGSLYAEVFPLNDLFTALVLLLGLEFVARSEAPRDAPPQRGRLSGPPERALAGLALASGFASAHHQMIALTAPALLVLLTRGDHRLLRDPGRCARLFACFLTPLLALYGLLWLAALRRPLPSWGDLRSLSDLLRLACRADYGGLFSPFLGAHAGGAEQQLEVYAESLGRSLGGAGAALVALGTFSLWRRRADVALALGLVVLAAGPMFAVLNALPVADEGGVAFAERFVSMSLVPLGVLAGSGIAAVESAVSVALPKQAARVVCLLSVALPIHASWDVDLAHDRRGHDFALDAFTTSEEGALILITGDASNHAATYLCEVMRACGSRIVLSPGQLHMPWRAAQLARVYPELSLPAPHGQFVTTRELIVENLGRRPVYIAPLLLDREPGLREAFGYLPDHLWLRVLSSDDLGPEQARFRGRARAWAKKRDCAGCELRRGALLSPSLETGIVQAYVDAYVNHARIVRAYFSDEPLAAELEQHALAIDPHAARQYL